MFTKPTVFILGAGASWHYGYPTGEELVKRVIEKARELARYFQLSQITGNPYLPDFMLDASNDPHFGTNEGKSVRWGRAQVEAGLLASWLRQVNPTLIDFFLAQNPRLHEMGRLAIAMVLLDCEAVAYGTEGNPNRNHIFGQSVQQGLADPTMRPNPSAFRDDWLRFVLYKITAGCLTGADLLGNKLTFVTFNYDMSLERRLHLGLKGLEPFIADAAKFLQSDRVIHVYGRVREEIELGAEPVGMSFPSEMGATESGVMAECKKKRDIAFVASRGIHTIDGEEKLTNLDAIAAAKAAIERAHNIYILGYGFDETNSSRIGLRALASEPGYDRTIMFTNFCGLNRVAKGAGRLFGNHPGLFLAPKPPIVEDRRFVDGDTRHIRIEMSTKNVYDALAEDFESLEAD